GGLRDKSGWGLAPSADAILPLTAATPLRDSLLRALSSFRRGRRRIVVGRVPERFTHPHAQCGGVHFHLHALRQAWAERGDQSLERALLIRRTRRRAKEVVRIVRIGLHHAVGEIERSAHPGLALRQRQ